MPLNESLQRATNKGKINVNWAISEHAVNLYISIRVVEIHSITVLPSGSDEAFDDARKNGN
jgi:hypothetical protein